MAADLPGGEHPDPLTSQGARSRHRTNLTAPLAGIRQAADGLGAVLPEVTVGLRTGDTSTFERQRMLRHPPQILITVYQPKGIVHIESRPTGARIRINGHDRDLAPKDLILPAGKAEITLSKSGYEPFSETLVVYDQDMIDIEARLQEAMPYPENYGISLPIFVGIDLGTDSIGMEVGIARAFGIATALRFTGDTAPVPEKMYNYGPELDLDLRLHVAITERVSLLLGGGIGLQNTALAPTVIPSLVPSAITIEPEIETEAFPSFVAGLEIDFGHAALFAGYHLQRGLIVGVGIIF